MKKVKSYAIVALFATVAVAVAGPDAREILGKEKAAWQAVKDKKADDFKKLLGAEFRGVYAEGISTVQTELADMQKWELKSFEIGDFKAINQDADTIVTTYTVTLKGTYDGKDNSGTFNAGSVWRKTDGEWHAVFHTNTKRSG